MGETPEHDGEESILGTGRQLLGQATDIYGRPLSPAEYWWMGVALAAMTLADLENRGYAVSRIEQLIDRLGYKGFSPEWLQRFVAELAELNAEGLLWPVYERSPDGPVAPTGAEVHPGFGGEAAYFLALGHIGVAVALNRGDQNSVAELAEVIAATVESGLTPQGEQRILQGLQQGLD